ncbi:MAG: sodium:solute symporter [Lewinellaceae bacterium]|nr:sodium:solute symporter [Lewinellaceae bacterium]MCB9289881.1 sodium:solute symporter [Lewinellaceae bacterium]
MTPTLILGIIAVYFLLLITVSYYTGRRAGNAEFFLAGRKSPWYLVAIGMIGASLSGVTFISIPGVVGDGGANQSFSYMQMVFGYLVGYLVIAQVLLPLYYRLNLTSIYTFLGQRLGYHAYKTGAAYFMLSRTIGAAFRLYLVAIVLQQFVLGPFGIPFAATVAVTIVLIWIYTFKGGINTIVYTDTLQTVCMISAVILTIIAIGNALETDLAGLVAMVRSSDYSQMFFFQGGWNDPNNFFKQFISGALIAIVMTGLDQDMMQKNLSCRNIGEAQKNVYTFSVILVFANLLFLTLGALLYIYAASIGLEAPEKTDQLFPTIALRHLSPAVGVFFVLGLIAAAYSSADSALTALTTSFCVDFLGFEQSEATEQEKRRTRTIVHISISLLLLLIIVAFNALNNDAVISQLFLAAGYTYGPILGLFAFGMLTRRQVHSIWVIPICIAAPILSYIINANSASWLFGFEFGFLIIALNGLLTFAGLWAISRPGQEGRL